MAINWTPKAPGDVVRYTWTPALAEGDGIVAYTASASGATITLDSNDSEQVILFISGGTAGTTATITLSADTASGETLTETGYLPIVANTAILANTARDICLFALRKVTGIAEEPDANQLADALERLSDMLAAWNVEGATVGVPFPILEATVFNVPDSYVSGIKANLTLLLADLYGVQVGPIVVRDATRGLQRIKNANLYDPTRKVEYF